MKYLLIMTIFLLAFTVTLEAVPAEARDSYGHNNNFHKKRLNDGMGRMVPDPESRSKSGAAGLRGA